MQREATFFERLVSGIAHTGILFYVLGIVFALVAYILSRTRSPHIRDHAKQALGYQLVMQTLAILSMWGLQLVGIEMQPIGAGQPQPDPQDMEPAAMAIAFISLVVVIYAFYAAWQALMGREFRYALIGDLVHNL